MDAQLEAIKDTMDKDTGEGRNQTLARTLADEYVSENPDLFEFLALTSLENCVAFVETFRENEDEREQWIVETWLLHRYAPQRIGGEYQAELRTPGSEE